MLTLLGFLLLGLSTLGGYFLSGGHLATLFQPILFLMILGGAAAIFLAANNALTLKATLAALPGLWSSDGKAGNTVLRLEKVLSQLSQGDPGAARHAAKAEDGIHPLPRTMHDYLAESTQLASLPGMTADEFARMTATGLQSRIAETSHIGTTLRRLGHVTVAVGIMGCLLGFIHSGMFAAGPEYMLLLSYSMVGAFYGVFVGWGVIFPLGCAIQAKHRLLHSQQQCINLALGAHLRGAAPAVAIAAGRQALPPALGLSLAS